MLTKKNKTFSTELKMDNLQNAISDIGDATSDIEKFSEKVLRSIIEEGVPPTPHYFNIYFGNLLDEEPYEFKKQVFELMDLEANSEVDVSVEFEKKLKRSSKYSKEILQHAALIYKNSLKMNNTIKKTLLDTKSLTAPNVFKSALISLEKEFLLMKQSLENEMKILKELYSENISNLKEMEQSSIYDSVFGVYNNKFFLKELQKEMKAIEKFKHVSCLILVKATEGTLKKLSSNKSKVLVKRTIAKIMLKTSRRTDIVAHVGEGVFGMILKHTDRIGAVKTGERLFETIQNSAIFLEGNELDARTVMGISELYYQKSDMDLINCAMQRMDESEKEGTLYKICEE